MPEYNREQFIFDEARKFLLSLKAKRGGEKAKIPITDEILTAYLKPEKRYEIKSQKDLCKGLILGLPNRNLMPGVIGKIERFEDTLYEFEPNKISQTYGQDVTKLLQALKKIEPKVKNNKRSLWRQFAKGIISAAEFSKNFPDDGDFERFVNSFSTNEYSKLALPMLLSKEIKGFGFALSCSFLKEAGYAEYAKPDTHLKKIFFNLGLSKNKEDYTVFKDIVRFAKKVGETPYAVDKIFWLIGSGKFYRIDNKKEYSTGQNANKFIQHIKKKDRKTS